MKKFKECVQQSFEGGGGGMNDTQPYFYRQTAFTWDSNHIRGKIREKKKPLGFVFRASLWNYAEKNVTVIKTGMGEKKTDEQKMHVPAMTLSYIWLLNLAKEMLNPKSGASPSKHSQKAAGHYPVWPFNSSGFSQWHHKTMDTINHQTRRVVVCVYECVSCMCVWVVKEGKSAKRKKRRD